MTKFSTFLLATAALSLTAPAAIAADVSKNDRVYSADGTRIAKVSRVAKDGDILVIYKGKVRRIQSDTLSNDDGKLVTSLTKAEIRRLN